MFVWDISCQPLGEECKLGSFFATFGRVVVKCTFLKKGGKLSLFLNAEQITTKIHIGAECTSYWRINAKQSHLLIKLATSPDSWEIPFDYFISPGHTNRNMRHLRH